MIRAVLGFAMLLATVVALSGRPALAGVGSQEKSAAVPPHDYVLVVRPGAPPAGALSLIRDSVVSALALSGILAAGYPRRGDRTEVPSPTEPGVVTVSCSEPYAGSPDATCIRLGPTSHVQFATVVQPDSRVHLFEVWLLTERPERPVRRKELDRVPRIVVEYPYIGDDLKREREQQGRLLDVLQHGLGVAGAKPLTIE